ncbi:MAG: hypothetical protein K9M11_02225 [Candidatus Pacebacteria bacterium]|nr:hypothetical protein [Candidatus Paceibacterota bacterium]
MNTKTTIVLLGVLLIIVGAFSYYKGVKNGIVKGEANIASSTAQSTGTNTQNNTQVLGASFSCVDKTHFIAEFPDDSKVNIIVNGNIARTLPRVNGLGQRFEDAYYVYVFAGEEVSVTSKANKKTTTCSQPVDANNAPMNFGDAGEGGAGFATNGGSFVKPDVSLLVSESLVGKWQSIQDTKFVREFTKTGGVSDYYDGKLVTSGNWNVFTSEKPLKVSFPLEKDAIYVQLTDSTDKESVLDFKVTKITPESLELIYMERGGVNSFTRIK